MEDLVLKRGICGEVTAGINSFGNVDLSQMDVDEYEYDHVVVNKRDIPALIEWLQKVVGETK